MNSIAFPRKDRRAAHTPTGKTRSAQARRRVHLLAPAMAALCLALTPALPVRPALAQALAPASAATGTAAVAPGTPEGAAPAPAEFQPDYVVALREIGAPLPIKLHGVDGSTTLPFNVRADEVVTQARLTLHYSYSPAMLPELSQLNVLINDEVAGSIALPRETAGTLLEHTVEIPPRLITEFNRLRLQLIGHYTLDCEDPLHSSLWANVSNHSTLQWSVAPIAQVNDLKILPRPFFDRRDRRRLALPVVFGAAPDEPTLEAAGIVASWFGSMAGYRKAVFPASQGELPQQGHAVVMAVGQAATQALDMAPPTGPTLAMMANPNDPNGKLLVVAGRDAAEVKTAAIALATASQTLAGSSATIGRLAPQAPRKPYDAPRWVPTDRPAKLGELVERAADLDVSGYNPSAIRIDLRVPPDLFGWRAPAVPLDLKYRYTPQPESVNSSLLVNVDDQFIYSTPLLPVQRLGEAETWQARMADGLLPMQAAVGVPLDRLLGRSQLQLRYMYDYIKQGECRDIIIDNTRGAIDPESTLDVSGYPRYMAMPDLSAFASLGFPFTRMADLSETAVVLPDAADMAVYGAYLALMGHLGESTGHPATGVTVVRQADVQAVADKDLLMVAAGAGQPLLAQWADDLPASVDAQGKRFATSDLVLRSLGWTDPDPRRNAVPARTTISYVSDGAAALYAGFESPLSAGRSVVLVAASQPAGLDAAIDALFGGEGYERPVQGSLAIVRDKQVDALVAEHRYYLGELGWLTRLHWQLAPYMDRHPLAAFLICLLLAALAAGLAAWLWRRVRRARTAA